MAMKQKTLPEVVPKFFEHEQFGSIRVVTINGKPWFVGTDLCRALGYTNPQKAIRDHVDAEDKNTVTIRSGIPGNPNMVVVNESGMYALIFGSQLPAAKKFKRWVTNEVLPSIRETGSYTSPQYDFFHPSPEELERRSKITTTAGIIEDLEAHGIDWDWEVNPRIEIDEDGVKHLVYGCKLVIKHPEYEKLQKQRIAAKKSAEFLPD